MTSSSTTTAGEPTRRNFLHRSATLTAGLGVAAIARAAYAGGSDVVRVGLIGCGGRGTGAAVNAMNADASVRVVALADVFGDKVANTRNHLKQAKPQQAIIDDDHCFVGFDGCAKLIASGLDLVLIACASRYHPPYLAAAVEAGKHVFVEKPHAIDPPGVRLVAKACEQAKAKRLSVASGLMSRHSPAWRETVQRLHDGAIGHIVAAEVNYLRRPYVLVERRQGESEIMNQYRNWYHFNWLSGDDVIQSLVHNLDRVAWAMKEDHPDTAHGVGGRSASFGAIYGNVFDHHGVTYRFADGRAIYAFCRTQNGCHDEYSDILIGTKGRCDLMHAHITGETTWRYEGEKSDMYAQTHRALIAAIRAGTPMNDGAHMATSTMTAILGQVACYTGKQEKWRTLYESDFTFGPAGDCSFATSPPVVPGPAGEYPVPQPGRTKLDEL